MKERLLLIGWLAVAACSSASAGAEEHEDTLLDRVQRGTIDYFWTGAEQRSGLARERFHVDEPEFDAHVVTTGGTGFGIQALIAGIERGWIHPEAGLERFHRIVGFLENADRFHGAWPHWLDGRTGAVKPFSPNDDGADIVETAFLVQGLLSLREYYRDGSDRERVLSQRVDALWRGVEWDWFRQGGQNILYWHWSPNHHWEKNHHILGYNECLILYVLAAASPTHPIPATVYHEGWARAGAIRAETTLYDLPIALRHNGPPESVGPLFWAHYSFLGLDPRGLRDRYADYGEHNRHHALVHWRYALDNPKGYAGYGADLWGLTASYSPRGYAAHRPGDRDLGVISPTAALASYPYTPEASRLFLERLYGPLAERVIGPFGPYDAFSLEQDWFPKKYLAIDQGPIAVMIENHRSGLLWDLFMRSPEIAPALEALGFARDAPHPSEAHGGSVR